ncbi:MAG TPA: DUF2866 domain-containing protein [Paraburkholderia sp.]|jgi:hypothetical protein
MVEDTVFEHLRAMPGNEQALQIQTCTISAPLQQPWGRSCRLVEWTFKHDAGSCRRVVPAESTPRQIAEAVVSHLPGRRYCHEDN